MKTLLIATFIILLTIYPSHAMKFGGGLETERIISSHIDFLRRADNIVYTLSGAVRKRPPLVHYGSYSMHGPVYGLFDFWKTGVTASPKERFITLLEEADGSLQLYYGKDLTWNKIHTPTATITNLPVDFAVLGDKCVIGFANGIKPIQWDQDTVIELEDCGSSWIFEEFKNHMCAAGDPNYPSRVYISAPMEHRDSINFSVSASDATYIDVDPDDGDRIIGMKTFLGALYVFKGPHHLSIHKITGSSAADFARELVVEGVSGFNNTIVRFGNDLAFIDPNGIHTLSASEEFAGVREAFLSAKIQAIWNNVYTSYLDKAAAIHCSPLHSILFSVPYNGSFNTDILGYDYLVPNSDGTTGRWFKWAHIAAVSMGYKFDQGKPEVYIGTYDGYVAKIDVNATTYADWDKNRLDTAYTAVVETPYIYGNLVETSKNMRYLGLLVKGQTVTSDIICTLQVEGEADQTLIYDQKSGGFILDESQLDIGSLGGPEILVVWPTNGTPEGTGRNVSIKLENAEISGMEVHDIILIWEEIPGVSVE